MATVKGKGRVHAKVDRRKRDRKHKLKKRYGLTPKQYEDLLAEQNGVCAICGGVEELADRRLSVDHNHKTSTVRGLLCHHCNTLIGHANEDVHLLEHVIIYLKLHEASEAFKRGDQTWPKL